MITLRQTPRQRVREHGLGCSSDVKTEREKPGDVNAPGEISYVENKALDKEDAAGLY